MQDEQNDVIEQEDVIIDGGDSSLSADDDVFGEAAFATDDVATSSQTSELNTKLREHFDGKIVRKDLTKKLRQGANVPV